MKMNTTNKKIKELLQHIRSIIGDDKKSMKWFEEVQVKASKLETDEEKLEYLEGILDKLEKNDGEAANESKSNTWPAIALGVALFIIVVGGAALYFLFLAPKSANATNSSTATVSSTISKNAVKELELAVGKEAYAVIKATSVMVGIE